MAKTAAGNARESAMGFADTIASPIILAAAVLAEVVGGGDKKG